MSITPTDERRRRWGCCRSCEAKREQAAARSSPHAPLRREVPDAHEAETTQAPTGQDRRAERSALSGAAVPSPLSPIPTAVPLRGSTRHHAAQWGIRRARRSGDDQETASRIVVVRILASGEIARRSTRRVSGVEPDPGPPRCQVHRVEHGGVGQIPRAPEHRALGGGIEDPLRNSVREAEVGAGAVAHDVEADRDRPGRPRAHRGGPEKRDVGGGGWRGRERVAWARLTAQVQSGSGSGSPPTSPERSESASVERTNRRRCSSPSADCRPVNRVSQSAEGVDPVTTPMSPARQRSSPFARPIVHWRRGGAPALVPMSRPDRALLDDVARGDDPVPGAPPPATRRRS